MKRNYEEKTKYTDTNNFKVYIKTEDIYADIVKDVETRFSSSNYELERPPPKGKTKKVIGLMKDDLYWKIMKKISGWRADI